MPPNAPAPDDERSALEAVKDWAAATAAAAAARAAGLALLATSGPDPERNALACVLVAVAWPVLRRCACALWRVVPSRRPRRYAAPGTAAGANATRYYLALLREHLLSNPSELGRLAAHPHTAPRRDLEIERFLETGHSLHSYRRSW